MVEWARPDAWKPFLFTGTIQVGRDERGELVAHLEWKETTAEIATATPVISGDAARFAFRAEAGGATLVDLFRTGEDVRGGAEWIGDDGRGVPWSVVEGGRCWSQAITHTGLPFESAKPAGVALDERAVIDVLMEAQRTHTSGIVLLKDGKVVVAAGPDITTPVHVASVSKALSSLAVPYLIDEGRWASVDEPLGQGIPEWSKDPRGAITLRHVLTHTTGLETPEYFGWVKGAASDFRSDVLSANLVNEPGSTFEYSNRAVELTSVLVTQLTGEPLDDYVRPRLLGPMGIQARWAHDPSGLARVHAGVGISAIDLAKVGQLLLDRGRWEGRQVLPEWWVDLATTASTSGQGRGAGLGWFVSHDRLIIEHSGDSGALLMILPAERIVLARVHTHSGRAAERDRLRQHQAGAVELSVLALTSGDQEE